MALAYDFVPVRAGGVPLSVPTRRAARPALFFDQSSYRPERDEDEPPVPAPRPRQERVLLMLVFALLMLALVLPVSAGGLIDLAHYLFG